MPTNAWNPAQYEKFKSERSQPFFDLMELLEPLAKARIVDLGCGAGELTAELHRRMNAAETTGIDSSETMLTKARRFAGAGLGFEPGDIETWRPRKQVDIVFSNAAVQWCDGHAEIFQTMRDALTASGQIAVQMPFNQDYATHIVANQMGNEERWKKRISGDGGQIQRQMLAAEEYARLLFRLGFGKQKVLVRVYDHVLDSREGVIEWVKGTSLTYFEARLSKEDFGEFLSEYRERLFRKLPDDRPFFYPFKRILIWGRL